MPQVTPLSLGGTMALRHVTKPWCLPRAETPSDVHVSLGLPECSSVCIQASPNLMLFLLSPHHFKDNISECLSEHLLFLARSEFLSSFNKCGHRSLHSGNLFKVTRHNRGEDGLSALSLCAMTSFQT